MLGTGGGWLAPPLNSTNLCPMDVYTRAPASREAAKAEASQLESNLGVHLRDQTWLSAHGTLCTAPCSRRPVHSALLQRPVHGAHGALFTNRSAATCTSLTVANHSTRKSTSRYGDRVHARGAQGWRWNACSWGPGLAVECMLVGPRVGGGMHARGGQGWRWNACS
jgi:hypothetical protein